MGIMRSFAGTLTLAILMFAALTACQPGPAAVSTSLSSATVAQRVAAPTVAAKRSPTTIVPQSTVRPAPPAATRIAALPSPSRTTLAGASPAPTYSQQYTILEQDSGKTFVYPITSRFQIELDPQQYPQESLKVSCHPDGILGAVSNLPSLAAPLYAVRYEGVKPGKCTVTNQDFMITVQIVDLTN